MARPSRQGTRSAAPVSCVPEQAGLELHHRYRPDPIPGAVPAGITIDAYLMEPLRKALLLPRVGTETQGVVL